MSRFLPAELGENIPPYGIKSKISARSYTAGEIGFLKIRDLICHAARPFYHSGDSRVAAGDDRPSVFNGPENIHDKVLFLRRCFKEPSVICLVNQDICALFNELGGGSAEEVQDGEGKTDEGPDVGSATTHGRQ